MDKIDELTRLRHRRDLEMFISVVNSGKFKNAHCYFRDCEEYLPENQDMLPQVFDCFCKALKSDEFNGIDQWNFKSIEGVFAFAMKNNSELAFQALDTVENLSTGSANKSVLARVLSNVVEAKPELSERVLQNLEIWGKSKNNGDELTFYNQAIVSIASKRSDLAETAMMKALKFKCRGESPDYYPYNCESRIALANNIWRSGNEGLLDILKKCEDECIKNYDGDPLKLKTVMISMHVKSGGIKTASSEGIVTNEHTKLADKQVKVLKKLDNLRNPDR